jgi:hypothetical protein
VKSPRALERSPHRLRVLHALAWKVLASLMEPRSSPRHSAAQRVFDGLQKKKQIARAEGGGEGEALLLFVFRVSLPSGITSVTFL